MHQLPFAAMLPQSDWRPPNLSQLPSWAGAKRVAFDVETRDPDLFDLGIGVRRPDSYMVGYSFSIEDGPMHYVPIRHEGGDNVDEQAALQYLRDQAKHFDGLLVGANLSYDTDYAAHEGAVFRNVKWMRDVQVADPLLWEHHLSYSLDNIAKRWGIPMKNEEMLIEAAKHYGAKKPSEVKGVLWRLPARYVGAYAEWDAAMCHDIIRKQERKIDDEDMWNIYNLESELLPILVKMRRRGIAINLNRYAMVRERLVAMGKEVCNEINRHTKTKIAPSDLKKNAALGPMLEAEGIKVGRTAQGKYSITKDWLAAQDHPVCKMLNEARASATMLSYAASTEDYLVNGRIHPTFNQLKAEKEDGSDTKGTVSGRLSCNDPNEQQKPIRHPTMGAVYRGMYVPDFENGIWVSSDYSQQEPRLTVHYAELTGCRGASEAAQRYRDNPNEDNHTMMAELTGLNRKNAKGIFLGKCYSMGGAKFCDQVGLPTMIKQRRDGRKIRVAGPEGQKLLDQFDRMVPWVKQIAKMVENKAKRRGEIRTLLGRVIHFPTDAEGNFDWTHKALNRLIQGGSADQMKKAMIDADKAGIRLQLQVHDEVDFSARNMEEAEHLAEIMRNAVPLNVPSRVDLECGPSWGEINEEGQKLCKEFYGDN